MINENQIEQSFIEQLIGQGYTYFAGSEISPNGANPQTENFTSVILGNHFKESLKKLNHTLTESSKIESFYKVINLVRKTSWKTMSVFIPCLGKIRSSQCIGSK